MTTHLNAPEYTVARIREALALDERTNVLDVHIWVRSGVLYLSGRVDSDERSRLIEQVARENLPRDVEIDNQLTVADDPGPETEYLE